MKLVPLYGTTKKYGKSYRSFAESDRTKNVRLGKGELEKVVKLQVHLEVKLKLKENNTINAIHTIQELLNTSRLHKPLIDEINLSH